MSEQPTEKPVEPSVQPDTNKTNERNLIFLVFDAEQGKPKLSDHAPKEVAVDFNNGKWHYTEGNGRWTYDIGSIRPYRQDPDKLSIVPVYGVFDCTNLKHLQAIIDIILEVEAFIEDRRLHTDWGAPPDRY